MNDIRVIEVKEGVIVENHSIAGELGRLPRMSLFFYYFRVVKDS